MSQCNIYPALCIPDSEGAIVCMVMALILQIKIKNEFFTRMLFLAVFNMLSSVSL